MAFQNSVVGATPLIERLDCVVGSPLQLLRRWQFSLAACYGAVLVNLQFGDSAPVTHVGVIDGIDFPGLQAVVMPGGEAAAAAGVGQRPTPERLRLVPHGHLTFLDVEDAYCK